jgi:hypothetical protein
MPAARIVEPPSTRHLCPTCCNPVVTGLLAGSDTGRMSNEAGWVPQRHVRLLFDAAMTEKLAATTSLEAPERSRF